MQPSSDEQLIGVIGLGDMGGAIATSMVRHGRRLVVLDLRPEMMKPLVDDGAIAASTVEEVAGAADIISIVVVTDAQVREVVSSIEAAGRPGTVMIVHSTIQPNTITELAAAARQRDMWLIDAAVSGGSEKGRLGLLTVMVGGEDEPVARCRPVFEAFATNVFHVGPPGAGAATKIVNNLLSLGSYALQMEAMRLGAAYGVDEDTITTVVTTSQGDARGLRTWGRHDRIRRERQDGGWSDVYERLAKDLRAAVVAAGSQTLVLPLTSVAAAVLPSAAAERDRELAYRPSIDIPRCRVCEQELAAPYREHGAHPECAGVAG